jgi:protein-S-isoprenylcysteine O-methyltransferase Ste14
MPRLALAGYTLFVALAFGLRIAVHLRRTGTTGFIGLSRDAGVLDVTVGSLFVLALVAGALAPGLQLAGLVRPWRGLDVPAARLAAVALYGAGLVGTLWAQFAMGDAWRIGVRETERTALVAGGPFRWVRNPIYSSMLLVALGLSLAAPNVLSVLALVALLVALELQVRLVEEPYLTRAHGTSYRSYASRTGRFVPGWGRL